MNSNPQLTGLSLSGCVINILKGNIKKENVREIYCAFSWEGEFCLTHIPQHYWDGVWKDFSTQQVFDALEGLEILPDFPRDRFSHKIMGSRAKGHWMIGEITLERLQDPEDRLSIQQVQNIYSSNHMNLFEIFKEALEQQSQLRHQYPNLTWIQAERELVFYLTNEARVNCGLPATITMEQIERCERRALGADYISKFALYCSELVMEP